MNEIKIDRVALIDRVYEKLYHDRSDDCDIFKTIELAVDMTISTVEDEYEVMKRKRVAGFIVRP